MREALAHGVARITRLYPLCSGCGTLANSRALRWLTPRTPEIWGRLRSGERVRIRPNDWVGRSIYFFGDLDPKISWVLKRLLRPGDTVLDIGANQGLVTFRAATLVGPTGEVHAFEPQPDLLALIRRTLSEEPRPQVRTHELALSDREGRERLAVPSDNAGAGSLEAGASGAQSVEVQLRTLDSITCLADKPLRLMKLDVEGHEESVLRGAVRVLERTPPQVVLFESQDDRPLDERPPVRLLKEHGYIFADLPRARFTPRAEWVGADGVTQGHDLIAIHAATGTDAAARLGLILDRRVTLDPASRFAEMAATR